MCVCVCVYVCVVGVSPQAVASDGIHPSLAWHSRRYTCRAGLLTFK